MTLRLHTDLGTVDAGAWDALLATQAAPTPFMRHAFLAALTETGCATPATGWQPVFATLHDDGDDATMVAAAPLYLKSHSWGEYVFDQGWANAFARHGLAYYPKLVVAVPFTPVPGTRLLARDAAARRALAAALPTLAERLDASSVHVLFGDDDGDASALGARGWSRRDAVQFHWTRDEAEPAASFDDLVARMQRHKRKNIVQERRRVAEAGVTFEVLEGEAIDDATWDFFHRCYVTTYRAHGQRPYLTRAFFTRFARELTPHALMFVASNAHGRRIAASFVVVDRARGLAWGRHWGAVEHVPLLHFEACYYRPLEWSIAQGFRRFEGGAQGAHKMARGLLPTVVHSSHRVRDERFARAIDEAVAAEREDVDRHVDELRERSPFRRAADAPAAAPTAHAAAVRGSVKPSGASS